MRLRNHRILAGASVALVALMIAACSSSSSSVSSSGGSQTSSSEIPVGVIGSYSGPAASSVAGAESSIQAWADSVNAAGGINGHRVQLYIVDDAGNSATALTGMKTLVEQDHVVAIVGQASTDASPWESYIDSKGIPVVGGNTASVTYLSDPNFYAVGGNLLSGYYGVTALAKANGPKLGDLYCAEIPACAATTTLLQTFGKSLGVSMSYSSKVSAAAPDFTAVCQGLKSAGVQSYSLGLAAVTLKQVATQCALQGLKAQLIISNVADSTFPSDPGFNGIEVVDAMFPFFDDSTPATREFHAALTKYAPALGTPASPLNSEVTQAWASGKLFEAAVKAAGNGPITPASIKKGLYALKGETLGGLTVPLTYTPGKPSPQNCYFTYSIQGGKFIEPDGLKTTCAPEAVIAAAATALGLRV
jgi:branched-chain amino acid transport system substrate-binding protein